MTPNYLNAEQAAALTGYSRGYIYNLVHRRQIPHEKGRRFVRFEESALREWLNSQFVQVPTTDQLRDDAAAYVTKHPRKK